MRDNYNLKLKNLNNDVILMSNLCIDLIEMSIKAIFNSDGNFLDTIVKKNNKAKRCGSDIENSCLSLLLHEQPVASDLRLVTTALQMINDLNRICEQALNIAEIVKTLQYKDEELLFLIQNMGSKVIKMLHMTISVFVNSSIDDYDKNSIDKLNLIEDAINFDDEIDKDFFIIKNKLISLIKFNEENQGSSILDLFMVAKYLERSGDHATNIARHIKSALL